MGPNGNGKTTLIDAMTGLVVSQGMTFSGRPLMPPESLMAFVAAAIAGVISRKPTKPGRKSPMRPRLPLP
jgi:ABC-type uncharacterized transport system ATPase subunit